MWCVYFTSGCMWLHFQLNHKLHKGRAPAMLLCVQHVLGRVRFPAWRQVVGLQNDKAAPASLFLRVSTHSVPRMDSNRGLPLRQGLAMHSRLRTGPEPAHSSPWAHPESAPLPGSRMNECALSSQHPARPRLALYPSYRDATQGAGAVINRP